VRRGHLTQRVRSLVPYIVRLGFAGALVAACQAPDEYFWGPDAGGGVVPPVAGRGGPVTGTGGSATGTGGLPPTGLGGTTGVAGSIGTAGTTGTGGSPAGTGGTTGAAGNVGPTGAGGSAAGRGGTTGNAGTTGTAGGTGTVLFSDDFENETVDATNPAAPSGWSRSGGSSSDWHIATDGTKVLQQDVKLSTTVGIFAATGASGWSGAVSASARVKMIEAGSSNQVALLCVRYNDNSNRYCGALVPGGVQILTVVGGTAGGSNVFSVSGVTPGTFYDLRISVDASNALTVFLNGTQRGTYMPASMTSGTVAVGTASMTAAFDNVTVTRP